MFILRAFFIIIFLISCGQSPKFVAGDRRTKAVAKKYEEPILQKSEDAQPVEDVSEVDNIPSEEEKIAEERRVEKEDSVIIIPDDYVPIVIDDSQSDREEEDQPNATPIPEESSFALSWQWSCKNGLSLNTDISGDGEHRIALGGKPFVNLRILGNACEPIPKESYVTFVVDASSSMKKNDPYTNGSCGRYDAINEVINILGEDQHKHYSIALFSSRKKEKAVSSKFFSTRQELLQDIAYHPFSEGTAKETLCDHDGGTYYSAGLTRAENLFNQESISQDDLKTIILLSDGKPDESDATLIQKSNEFKNDGFKMGTISLVEEVSILKQMASTPSFFVYAKNASSLTKEVSKLAEQINKRFSYIRWRKIGGTVWKEEAINPTTTKNFALEFKNIKAGDYPSGIEYEFETFKEGSSESMIERAKIYWE